MRLKKFVEKIKYIINFCGEKLKSSPWYGRTLLLFFVIAFVVKIVIVYFSSKHLDYFDACFSYIASDIIVLFLVQLLITINSWIKIRQLRLFNDILVFVLLVIYCVDIFIIFFFQSRASVSDAFTLGGSGSVGFAGAVRIRILVFLIIGCVSFFLVQSKKRNKIGEGKKMTIIFSVCSIFYAIFYMILAFLHINVTYVDNILSINLRDIGNIAGSLESSGNRKYEDYLFNVQGDGKNLNIILVFAESLSVIDSENVGGNNNMPYFDKIQNNGIKYTNFITNGTTSDTAHIATLYGVIPLINMGANNTPYSGYKLLMQPLPQYLNAQGYHTTFISAASLKFLDQRTFLSGAGFQTIIGEEAFTRSKKYAFDSAPDGDLYDRALQEVKAQTGKYFIGLQTISFHRPYNTPMGKTESLALQYSDEELYRFYQELEKMGFFNSGILVIVGDHRKMNPAEEGERELFGGNWYTKSVATVVGSGIQPGTVNSNIIQHTDLYNSIKKLLGNGVVKIDKTYNDIFSNKIQRDWGITNAEFYEINRYTVSSVDKEPLLFRNVSNLLGKNDEVYRYFSSYLGFEFGNNKVDGVGEEDDPIKLIGHRGSIDDSPENTLQSFLSAKEKGAVGIEFDVSYTKDRQNIVAHGEDLYASNCIDLKVGDYTLDWIKKNCTIVNGEKYQTLQEMLEMIDGLFDYYFVEIKVYDEGVGAEQAENIIQTVKELNMLDKVIFISYSDSARNVLNSHPDVIFGRDTFNVGDLDSLRDNNSKYFLAPYDLLTPEIVERARSLGKEVVTYTVNDTGNFQLMRDMGVNIIMTDKINLLQECDNTGI